MGIGSVFGSIGRAFAPRMASTSARTPSFMGDDYEDEQPYGPDEPPPAPDDQQRGPLPPPRPPVSAASQMGGNAPQSAPPQPSPQPPDQPPGPPTDTAMGRASRPASAGAAMGGGALPATYRPELDPDTQKYLDAARQPAPMHPQHGRLRTVGEALTGGFLGQPLANEIWDPKYAAQKRQYEHNLQSAALPAQIRAKAEAGAATTSHTMAAGALAGKQAENYDANAVVSAAEHGGEIQPDNPQSPPTGQAPREGSTLPVGGKRVFFPSKAQTAKETTAAKKEAEQATEQVITPEMAEKLSDLGVKAGEHVPANVFNQYQRIIQKADQQPQLKFEHFTNQRTGDVTTIGFHPVTGQPVTRSVEKGVAEVKLPNPNIEGRKDRTAGLKAYTPALESAERFNVMTKNYEDAIKTHDQQAMLSLLANHLGMTMGLQKGARLTKDIIHEAERSRPWLQGLVAQFDGNGYLSGVNLTPEQMRQMVNLGRERFAEDISKGRSEAKYMGVEDDGPARTPSRATMNHYLGLTGGDVTKAKALAATDGWSVK